MPLLRCRTFQLSSPTLMVACGVLLEAGAPFAYCQGQSQKSASSAVKKAATKLPAKSGPTDANFLAKLATLGVKVQVKAKDQFFITKGYPYQKEIPSHDVIEIAHIERGVFTASESSLAPLNMGGMVYLAKGAKFMAQVHVVPGTKTLADAVGNTWIFQQPGMTFDVYLGGKKPPVYSVRSLEKGATIHFTEQGVELKGFALGPPTEE